jgi:hypothetical protein
MAVAANPVFQRIEPASPDEIKREAQPIDAPFVAEIVVRRRFDVCHANAIRAVNDLLHGGTSSRANLGGTPS